MEKHVPQDVPVRRSVHSFVPIKAPPNANQAPQSLRLNFVVMVGSFQGNRKVDQNQYPVGFVMNLDGQSFISLVQKIYNAMD
jgi:hypothetical protein